MGTYGTWDEVEDRRSLDYELNFLYFGELRKIIKLYVCAG